LLLLLDKADADADADVGFDDVATNPYQGCTTTTSLIRSF
jgi:hypothetical protein